MLPGYRQRVPGAGALPALLLPGVDLAGRHADPVLECVARERRRSVRIDEEEPWSPLLTELGEPLSFALYTSLAFDLTVTSLFTPLVSGGRLYLYPRREGEYPLLDILADDRADVLKLTPSHLELIKERDNRGSRVRRLIVGGAGSKRVGRDDQHRI